MTLVSLHAALVPLRRRQGYAYQHAILMWDELHHSAAQVWACIRNAGWGVEPEAQMGVARGCTRRRPLACARRLKDAAREDGVSN